jgi:hypothetical protein
MRAGIWASLAGLLLATTQARAQAPAPAAPPLLAPVPSRADPGDHPAIGAPPFEQRLHLDLDYAGAPGCAEAGLFEDAVRFHFYTWEPFVPIAPLRLTVRVTRHGPGYDAWGELRTAAGELRWARKLVGPYRCYDAVKTLALVLRIEVGPPATRPKPAAPVCPEQPAVVCPEQPAAVWPSEPALEPLPPPLQPPALTTPPPERPRLAFRAGAALWPEIFATDGGAFGISIDLGVRYRAFSASIEAHGDPPLGSHLVAGLDGTVSEARAMGALLLCGHYGVFTGCGLGAGGAILFPSHVSDLPASTRYGAVGIRLGLEFPVAPPFLLRVGADLLLPFWRTAFVRRETGTNVFEIASLNAGLGLGGVWEVGKP